jgi:hypothetical protein
MVEAKAELMAGVVLVELEIIRAARKGELRHEHDRTNRYYEGI